VLARVDWYSIGWLNTKGYGATLDSNQLDKIFAALADPVRRQIVARLAEGDATVNELAEPFTISVQAISKHLKVLERAGLITRGRDAQRRPCSLNADALAVATDWIQLYRRRKEQQLDRLEALLQNDPSEKEASR
jgi:DNA-binding transcriptional ArsR family regulator